MAEEKKSSSCSNCCGCENMGCDNHYGFCSHKHSFVKKIAWVLLFVIIFCFGVQIGELKGELKSFYRHNNGMMGWNSNSPMGYGLIELQDNSQVEKTATPTAPAAKTKAQ